MNIDRNQTNQISEMQRKLRKMKNNLAVSGVGIIAISLWSIIKEFLEIGFHEEYRAQFIQILNVNEEISFSLYLVATAIILGIYFLIVVYVGQCAIAEGRDLRKRYLYIFISLLFLAVDIWGLRTDILNPNYRLTFFEVIGNVLLDLTKIGAFMDLIYTSVMSKVLQRKISLATKEEAGKG